RRPRGFCLRQRPSACIERIRPGSRARSIAARHVQQIYFSQNATPPRSVQGLRGGGLRLSGGVGADRPCACSHQARREGRPITSNVLQLRLANARADACMVTRTLGSEVEGGTVCRVRRCKLLAVEG